MPGRIYVGTSTWADKSLVDAGFYPKELKDTPERLGHFAKHFNFAEIDSTYYTMPSRRNMERWGTAVPDGFRFSIKAFALHTQHPARLSSIPKSFHERLPEETRKKARVYEKDVPQDVVRELWDIFRRSVAKLQDLGRFGAVLVDLPPWSAPNEANRAYIARLRDALPDEKVVVEFRNPAWVTGERAGETFDLLRAHGLGYMCVDEPPGAKTALPPVAEATAPVAAVRFRGRNAERWDEKGASVDEKLNWWYTDEELSEWVPRIERLAAACDEVYVSFNTKAADQSVQNAMRLQRLLGL